MKIASGCASWCVRSTDTSSAGVPARPATTSAGAKTSAGPGMRPRTELALGAGLFLALAVVAGLVGSSRSRLTDGDTRRSTFLAGPGGAQGWAEALERLGVGVERFRRPVAALVPPSSPRTLVAFLGSGLTSRGGSWLSPDCTRICCSPGPTRAPHSVAWATTSAPTGVTRSFWCRRLAWTGPRSLPGTPSWRRRPTNLSVDSTDAEDAPPVVCTAPAARRVDTLLRSASGRAVALRAALSDGRTVTLVADDRLFANRALRESGAGPFALGLVVPRYDRVVVDEYHHGFDASRSMAGAATAWMLRSPWGWAILQLAGVGVLGLVAAGVRFGPIHSGIERRRRSPLEHVRALATALAAARGHDVAVGLIVQGLRRRLSRAGRISRGELGPWLDGLGPAVRTPARPRGARQSHRHHPPVRQRGRRAPRRRCRGNALGGADPDDDRRHRPRSEPDEASVARRRGAPPRGGARRRGARPAGGGAGDGRGAAGPGPRAPGGRAGDGQDAARPGAGTGARARVPPDPVHAGSHAERHHGGEPARGARGRSRSGPVRSSATWSWATRSTARRPRPRRRCSRQCRSGG